jgi:hypothetical protein
MKLENAIEIERFLRSAFAREVRGAEAPPSSSIPFSRLGATQNGPGIGNPLRGPAAAVEKPTSATIQPANPSSKYEN